MSVVVRKKHPKPPRKKHRPMAETSLEAYVRYWGARPSQRRRILEMLIENGPMTCEEIEHATGLRHQTASARLSELSDPEKRLVRRNGQTRQTTTGASAFVWKVVKF